MARSIVREVVYMTGRFLDTRDDARVSLFDRGYLLGDAVFETLRAADGVPWLLDRHLDRLEHGARALALRCPVSRGELAAIVVEAVARLAVSDAVLRVTLSRGIGPRGVGCEGFEAPVLSVVASPRTPLPQWAYAEGIDTRLVRTRRIPASCVDPSFKHANYLPQLSARRELEGPRMLEGVMCAVDGQVASGIVSNLFLVVGGRLRTPALDSGCLPGITRALVLAQAPPLGIEVEETTLTPEALSAADELFFTSTQVGILPVARLHTHAYGERPITRRLMVAVDAARRRQGS